MDAIKEVTIRTKNGLFIVVDRLCNGKVLETDELVVDYCNTNKLSIKEGRESLSDEWVSKLKF